MLVGDETRTTEAALSDNNIRFFQRTEDDEIIDALLILSRVTSAVSGLCELNAILKVGLKTLNIWEVYVVVLCFWTIGKKALLQCL